MLLSLLFLCRFQTILRSFWDFSVFRLSTLPTFLQAFNFRKKNRVTKLAVHSLSLFVFPHCCLITPNCRNRLLRPLPTFFDAMEVGFAFLGFFNTILNIYLSMHYPRPTGKLIPIMCRYIVFTHNMVLSVI